MNYFLVVIFFDERFVAANGVLIKLLINQKSHASLFYSVHSSPGI